MKPARSILDPDFVWIPSHLTDVRATFERARKAAARVEPAKSFSEVLEQVMGPACINDASHACDCPSWWEIKKRGCRREAMQRYGEGVVRFEPRPDHDLGPDGQRLKAGK